MRKLCVVAPLALLLVACGATTISEGSSSTSIPSTSTSATQPAPVETTLAAPVEDSGHPSITVGGVGRVYAEPIRCVVDIGVTARRPTVYESSRAAAASATAMSEVLLGQGIDPEDIQTTDYSVSPYYEDWPSISGYETTLVYRVVMSEIDEVGAVLAAATEAGGDDVRANGIRFEADADDLTDEAREMAWADVTHRAEQTATLAGGSLGQVLDVHEKVLVSTSRGMYQGGEGDAASFDIPVSPGVSGVVVLLTVTFELE